VLATRPGFDVERIVEVVLGERVELRGLDREAGRAEDRVVLVVKLRPFYRPDQLFASWAAWTACARSSGSGSQRSPRRSGSSAGSQVRPTRNGPKRP
jgi:hypothetical protein